MAFKATQASLCRLSRCDCVNPGPIMACTHACMLREEPRSPPVLISRSQPYFKDVHVTALSCSPKGRHPWDTTGRGISAIRKTCGS